MAMPRDSAAVLQVNNPVAFVIRVSRCAGAGEGARLLKYFTAFYISASGA